MSIQIIGVFLMELNSTEVLNSSDGVINIILNYGNGQKNPKSQDELENAVVEALNDLSLNVIQACIKKTQRIYQQF
ncbi:unnamed protein product, partial [Rotaria socialis]